MAAAVITTAGADLVPRHVPEKPDASRLWPGLRDDLVIVKFVEGDAVRLRDGRLLSLTNGELTGANRLLAENPELAVRRLFTRSEEELERDRLRAETRSGRQMADLNNYYSVTLAQSDAATTEALLDALNALPEVEIAYAEPIPELASLDVHDEPLRLPTPDFQDMQDYMEAAPTGIDAYAAWAYAGGRGETVKVIDIEIGWNWSHEDMKTPFFQGGPITYSDHGIAVMGVIMAQDNGYGVTGIANEVEAGCFCVLDVPTADVFEQAVAQLDPGDIYVIELHCPGPNATGYGQYGYIALEWWQANFDVVAMASANGIICCEAAGNGEQDFDDPVYEGRFDRNVRDSGAIIVGATNGANLAPAGFTNHGSRVDLAGWGYDVVTTGYGDLYGGNQNEYYTAYFSGTSSATPIVTGAVAAMQGIYKAHSGGVPLSGNTIAQILKDTGTATTGPQHIGPRPNLALGVPAMLDDLAEIAGYVTEAGTRTPIEGAEIRIVESGTRTVSAADGAYALPITAGTWTVRTESFGYVTDDATVETTDGGTAVHDVELVLSATQMVSGRVIDDHGAPVPSATVAIDDTPLDPVTTDENGNYEFADVPVRTVGVLVATGSDLTPDKRSVLVSTMPAYIDLRLAAPETFEDDDGGMSVVGGQWQWGAPSYENGPEAHSGARCWGTNLTDNYSPYQTHRLETPDYDLTDMVDPRLTFWHWYSIWGPYDGINVSISVDGGSWEVIEPVGGYSDPCIDGLPGDPCPPGWTGTTDDWVPAVFDLRDYVDTTVSFRFTLGCYGYTGSPGWYIDDLQVHGRFLGAVDEAAQVTRDFLATPVPSITSGAATMAYGLSQPAHVDAHVFDVTGREVRRLWAGRLPAGHHQLHWDGYTDEGLRAAPGIYFVRLRTEGRPELLRRLAVVR
jgi:hypothetical protein